MGSAASGRGLSIEYFSDLVNQVSKNWDVLPQRKYTCMHTDYSTNKKPKLLVYFRRVRASQFFLTRDLLTLKNTLSKSHSPRSLTAVPI